MEDISVNDPQVAYDLLRHFSGFCRTLHLACGAAELFKDGLHSHSRYSSVSLIASFCSSGFATADSHHLIHGIIPLMVVSSLLPFRDLSPHTLDSLSCSSLNDSLK